MPTLMERDIALVTKDSSGNNVIEYPVTRAAQVEDLATVITDAIKAQAPSPANMKGATASAAGTAGLVPAPAAGKNNMPLCGDATFKTLPIAGGGTGLTAAPSMLTNLGSTTAASPLQASPRPGITGTLPLGHGGTGATTAAAAIKALIGSTAIGSTTKPVYYDGAGALKACAYSIGGGGIVAALLEQNGYVKFANGLIIQWGIRLGNNNDAVQTLPISCNKIFVALETSYGGEAGLTYETGGSTSAYTTTSLKTISGQGHPLTWIAICA